LQSHLQDLCEVQRFPVRALLDLLAAAETIGHDQRVARRARTAGNSTRSPMRIEIS